MADNPIEGLVDQGRIIDVLIAVAPRETTESLYRDSVTALVRHFGWPEDEATKILSDYKDKHFVESRLDPPGGETPAAGQTPVAQFKWRSGNPHDRRR